jgi:hypothetical protein
MKRSTKLMVFGFLTIMFIVAYGITYAVSPTQQVKIAAEEELPKLKEFVSKYYKEFHFDSISDLDKAYLGEPIENYIIYDFDSTRNVEEQMEKMPFYVLPVMVDGKAVTDVTVMLESEQWKVIDIGGNLSTLIQNSEFNDKLTDIKVLRFD